MKTDIKRLHKVHFDYPNTVRQQGKTFYCFDQLLRIAQTGEVKEQAYITNDEKAKKRAFRDFLEFMTKSGEEFKSSFEDSTVNICDCEIKFISLSNKKKLEGSNASLVEDLF